jgi:carboxylesterase type B
MYKSAVHAVELAYVFNNLKDDIYAGEVDPRTAAKVQESWVNFARRAIRLSKAPGGRNITPVQETPWS